MFAELFELPCVQIRCIRRQAGEVVISFGDDGAVRLWDLGLDLKGPYRTRGGLHMSSPVRDVLHVPMPQPGAALAGTHAHCISLVIGCEDNSVSHVAFAMVATKSQAAKRHAWEQQPVLRSMRAGASHIDGGKDGSATGPGDEKAVSPSSAGLGLFGNLFGSSSASSSSGSASAKRSKWRKGSAADDDDEERPQAKLKKHAGELADSVDEVR